MNSEIKESISTEAIANNAIENPETVKTENTGLGEAPKTENDEKGDETKTKKKDKKTQTNYSSYSPDSSCGCFIIETFVSVILFAIYGLYCWISDTDFSFKEAAILSVEVFSFIFVLVCAIIFVIVVFAIWDDKRTGKNGKNKKKVKEGKTNSNKAE